MRSYIASFDSRIIGLTGAPEQIEALTTGVGAIFPKRQLDSASHAFDHSVYGFLLSTGWSRQGTLYMGVNSRRHMIVDALARLVGPEN